MAKATIELPNGTSVVIDGTPEEVRKLLEFYGGGTPSTKGSTKKDSGSKKGKDKKSQR